MQFHRLPFLQPGLMRGADHGAVRCPMQPAKTGEGDCCRPLLLIVIHYCITFSQKRISITATSALVALPCGVSVFSSVPLTIPAALAYFKASSA